MVKFTPKEKIHYARIKMQKKYPFFSYLAMHLNIQPTDQLPTAAVDFSGNMYYNPDWIDTLTPAEVVGILSHEVMHLGLEHLLRVDTRNKTKWNKATDYAINGILKQNNIQLPEGTLIDSKFLKMSAEQIYDKLPDPEQQQCDGNCDECEYDASDLAPQGADGGTVCGNPENLDGWDDHIYGDDADQDAKDKAREWSSKMSEAAEYARQQGKLPGGMEELIEGLYKEKINWKVVLRRYVRQLFQSDYTWMRPSKSSPAVGTYLPSVRKNHVDVVVAMDTSGSISSEELVQFKSEIVSMSRNYRNITITVLMHDSTIQDVFTLGPNSGTTSDDLIAKGRGGTDHRPVFDWINDNKRNCELLVCLTDGYSSFPDASEVPYDTVWVVVENYGDAPEMPFGHQINMDSP